VSKISRVFYDFCNFKGICGYSFVFCLKRLNCNKRKKNKIRNKRSQKEGEEKESNYIYEKLGC
jgi:hypothetical protein